MRLRPFPMGVSIGHYRITAGTAGCIVTKDGAMYLLSNNHVLADENEAAIGDPILQPGPSDDGKLPEDKVGELADFIPIRFPNTSCLIASFVVRVLNLLSRLLRRKTRFKTYSVEYPENQVDAAIASLCEGVYTPEIRELNLIPRGSARATVGMEVVKVGRTTGLTSGVVIDDDAAVRVRYRKGEALFTNQIIFRGVNVIKPGDSGSLLLNKDYYAVGLCFAGDSTGSIGIANHIYKVEELLKVRVYCKP